LVPPHLKSRLMVEFGQQLIEVILAEGKEDIITPFKDSWSKLYYGSSADITH
ncbi:hypothetical protein LCGC14_2956880, partial [marine sediment metagenome]